MFLLGPYKFYQIEFVGTPRVTTCGLFELTLCLQASSVAQDKNDLSFSNSSLF